MTEPYELIGLPYRLGAVPEKHGAADCLSLATAVQAWHGIWHELIALTTDATALSTPTTGSVPGQRGSLRELQRVARALLNSYGIDLS